MASCIRQSSVFCRKLLICNRTSYSKFYSSLSPAYHKIRSSNCSSCQFSLKELNQPKRLQYRNFSMDDLQTSYDSRNGVGGVINIMKLTLIEAHDSTGMPWWATIMSAATLTKLLCSLPSGVCQQFIWSKIELCKSELDASAESIRNKVLLLAREKKWSEQTTKSEIKKEMRKQWTMLVVKNNCHPFKNFILFLLQFPMWLLVTLSIREFARDASTRKMENPIPEMQFLVGGPFWSSNLAVPDPLFILPTINALLILAMGEISFLHSNLKLGDKKRKFLLYKIMPIVHRLLALIFFLVSSASPSGISLFWATSSFFALLQSLLLLSPRIRRLFRIPANPTDLSKPYSQLWTAFVGKYAKLFSRT